MIVTIKALIKIKPNILKINFFFLLKDKNKFIKIKQIISPIMPVVEVASRIKRQESGEESDLCRTV